MSQIFQFLRICMLYLSDYVNHISLDHQVYLISIYLCLAPRIIFVYHSCEISFIKKREDHLLYVNCQLICLYVQTFSVEKYHGSEGKKCLRGYLSLKSQHLKFAGNFATLRNHTMSKLVGSRGGNLISSKARRAVSIFAFLPTRI